MCGFGYRDSHLTMLRCNALQTFHDKVIKSVCKYLPIGDLRTFDWYGGDVDLSMWLLPTTEI